MCDEKPLQLVAYVLPVVFIAIGTPLALGLIAPNTTYGFRTVQALSSIELWYAVNRSGGLALILAAALSMAAIYAMFKYWAASPFIKMTAALIIPIVLVTAVSLAALRFG